jgi:DNA polymerase II small subunit
MAGPAKPKPGAGAELWGAILISDLHFGSKYFMEDAWNRFLAWVNCESEDPSGLSSGLKYIVIAGDIVDGIGIYPGQRQT